MKIYMKKLPWFEFESLLDLDLIQIVNGTPMSYPCNFFLVNTQMISNLQISFFYITDMN